MTNASLILGRMPLTLLQNSKFEYIMSTSNTDKQGDVSKSWQHLKVSTPYQILLLIDKWHLSNSTNFTGKGMPLHRYLSIGKKGPSTSDKL